VTCPVDIAGALALSDFQDVAATLSEMLLNETETRDYANKLPAAASLAPRGPADRIEQHAQALQSAFARGRVIEQGARDREHALQLLSHDMRAPQASIISLLETDGKGLAPALKARVAGYARRTLALADNFVQLARVQESPFRPEDVNLSDVLNEAIDELYPLYSARKIHVTAEGLDEPCYIMGEPALLMRVLINIIDNAIKYSADGGAIRCRTVYDGDNVRCTITDEGHGMSEAQVAGLFQRFSPVGGQRNEGRSGSGLGLALVKSAVERHGGTIACTSAIAKGTSFTLSFPAADEHGLA